VDGGESMRKRRREEALDDSSMSSIKMLAPSLFGR
jgi:hypothetical protein